MTSTVARIVSRVLISNMRPLWTEMMASTKGAASTAKVVSIMAGFKSSAPGKLRCSMGDDLLAQSDVIIS